MHPNTYLRTFWKTELRPEVFVAMSFAPIYQARFDNVIRPAIENVTVGGVPLKANRVDLLKTGDSILTDIVDGIAHAEMIVADVSTVGHDSKNGMPYRSGNVMYELGIALSCRQSSEVLILRDDKDKFLFDVSVVPHMHLDFADVAKARQGLHDEIVSRLRERKNIDDARLRILVSTLTAEEQEVLDLFASYGPDEVFYVRERNLVTAVALPRLLDKQLIATVGISDKRQCLFRWTRLGYALTRDLRANLRQIAISSEEDSRKEEG